MRILSEQEWLTCDDPRDLLWYTRYHPLGVGGRLRSKPLASDRQLRRFQCAVASHVKPMDKSHANALRLARVLADGGDVKNRLRATWAGLCPPVYVACWNHASTHSACAHFLRRSCEVYWRAYSIPDVKTQADIFRHVIGNAFQEWRQRMFSANVLNLANACYDGVDCANALADALEECGEDQLAEHFRLHPSYPGQVDCWALDKILGKE